MTVIGPVLKVLNGVGSGGLSIDCGSHQFLPFQVLT
jgi:hypothetical protein